MKKILLPFVLLCFAFFAKAEDTKYLKIYFQTNQSEVRESDVSAIRAFFSMPDSVEPVSVTLTGSCDDVGSEEANKFLASKRINAVRSVLTTFLKDTLSIQEVNLGRVQLIDAVTDTVPYRAANRKVLIALSYRIKLKTVEVSELISSQLKIGERIALNNILFEGGSSEFLPESNGSLLELYELLKSKPELKVCIRGHVCCTPKDRDGIDLSTGKYGLSVFRAQAVYSYLVNKGIAQERLTYKGLGASEPTGKGDRFDRRVEIEITADGK